MRHCSCLTSLLATAVAAGVVIFNSAAAPVAEPRVAAAADRNTEAPATRRHTVPVPAPRYAALGVPGPFSFDAADKRAALESVQYALSEIGDGSSYVWHRGHGKLSGVIQPTQSFKDAQGKICRHFVVMLASGTYSKRTETVACRMSGGIWQLDG